MSSRGFHLFKAPLLDKAWRDEPWGDKNQDLKYVKEYEPHSEAKHLRILLIGLPGSGKSSFINSVDSALRGRIAARASADTGFDHSFTKEYLTYKIQKENPGTYYNFVFSDTMGIEKGIGRGIDVKNFKQLLEGHVKEGCKLSVCSTPDGSEDSKIPTINDKVHVLVFIVDANRTHLMDDDIVQKMREFREDARVLWIPQMVVLTKIDETCPKVRKNIKNVYKSKILKKTMDEINANLGISLNLIFPVKNYSKETKTDEDTDTLILKIMRKIIENGEDHLNDIAPRKDTNKPVPRPRKFLQKQ